MTVGFLDFPVVPGRVPLVGDSPAIAVATYPLGTPLASSRVTGRRFNLLGKKSNGDDNAATVYIGGTGAVGTASKSPKKPLPLATGDSGISVLESDDGALINLADYYMTGTDGDGVRYLRVS